MKKEFLRFGHRMLFKILGRALDCGWVVIHTYNPDMRCRKFRLFGRTLYSSESRGGGKTDREVGCRDDALPVFYLKVNRDEPYTLICVQEWINVITELGADFYFVCDNKMLEYKILRSCYFKDGDIKFIRSIGRPIRPVAQNLYTDFWKCATYAHLTPFYHSKGHGIKKYWNIDADDTTILLKPSNAARALRKVEELSERERIAAVSLDMWRSRTHGRHWSLGVLYINDEIDFCSIFEANKDLKWAEEFKEYETAFNLDWFFTYLKNHNKANIQTFYIDNSFFIHWGGWFLLDPISSGIYFWKEGKVTFPILKDIFRNTELGVLDIADCYKISVGVDEAEGLKILENEICRIKYFTRQKRKLIQARKFAEDTEFFIRI